MPNMIPSVRRRALRIHWIFVLTVVVRFVLVPPTDRVGGPRGEDVDRRRLAIPAAPAEPSPFDYEITTTNYGWNTPAGRSFSRRILTGELFNATLAHPRYNASAWDDLERNPDPSRRIIAFLDLDTCIESNYPVYGAGNGWKVNMEANHPAPTKSMVDIVPGSCEYIRRAVASPAMTANPDSRLVLLDCCGVEKFRLRSVCGRGDPSLFSNNHVIVGYYSVEKANTRPLFDVGLAPPAIKPVSLTNSERDDIKSCKKRKYLFSFQGKGGFGRDNLLKFQNDTDMYIRIFGERDSYKSDIRTNGGDKNDFKGIMASSTFAGSPRGDLLFSYRFSEVLSAGAIPVVYADGWLPPYNEHVVDWSKCAVFIPESDYAKTGDILRAIPDDVRCEMQKCVLNVWDRFASSRAGWLEALVAVALSTSAFGINPLDSVQ